MLPKTLALLDDDAPYAEYLAQHLRRLGVEVSLYHSPSALLAGGSAYDFEFYVIDLALPGLDGVELIKLLRLRTAAGLLVVSGRSDPQVFGHVVKAGADMYLAKPVNFEQAALAIEAVHRRSGRGRTAELPWRLDRQARDLIAPDGTRISLSEGDQIILLALAEAPDHTVTREHLNQALGHGSSEGATAALNAAIFRLRRRIERATPLPVPLQARSRQGYHFRGSLKLL